MCVTVPPLVSGHVKLKADHWTEAPPTVDRFSLENPECFIAGVGVDGRDIPSAAKYLNWVERVV
jgi:hypothetical protein